MSQSSSKQFSNPNILLGAKLSDIREYSGFSTSQEMLFLGVLMIVIQLVDGLLTGIGVYKFGIDIEGNTLVKSLMYQIGYLNALVFVKTLSISVVLILMSLSEKVLWIPKAMKATIGIYILFAILPWGFLLSQHG